MPYHVKKLRYFVNFMAFYSHFTTNAPLTTQRKNDAGVKILFPKCYKVLRATWKESDRDTGNVWTSG